MSPPSKPSGRPDRVPNDEQLIERVRALAEGRDAYERKMFGSQAWMIGGNLACCVRGEDLLVRLGPDWEKALEEEHVERFSPGGESRAPMSGFVVVLAPGIADEAELASWVDVGLSYAASLPAK